MILACICFWDIYVGRLINRVNVIVNQSSMQTLKKLFNVAYVDMNCLYEFKTLLKIVGEKNCWKF